MAESSVDLSSVYVEVKTACQLCEQTWIGRRLKTPVPLSDGSLGYVCTNCVDGWVMAKISLVDLKASLDGSPSKIEVLFEGSVTPST